MERPPWVAVNVWSGRLDEFCRADYLHGTVIAWIDKTTPPSLVPGAGPQPAPTG